MPGQLAGRGVIEDERRWQPQISGCGQAVTQLDRGERVEALVAKWLVGRDSGGIGVAEDLRGGVLGLV